MRVDREVDINVDGVEFAGAAKCVSKTLLYHRTTKGKDEYSSRADSGFPLLFNAKKEV